MWVGCKYAVIKHLSCAWYVQFEAQKTHSCISVLIQLFSNTHSVECPSQRTWFSDCLSISEHLRSDSVTFLCQNVFWMCPLHYQTIYFTCLQCRSLQGVWKWLCLHFGVGFYSQNVKSILLNYLIHSVTPWFADARLQPSDVIRVQWNILSNMQWKCYVAYIKYNI